MIDYRRFFRNLHSLLAPVGLKAAIIVRIRFEERRAARRAVYVTVPILVASFGGFAWGVGSLVSSLSQSSLGQYLSLAVSDPVSVAGVWQSFIFTVIESLPLFALTIIIGTLLAFLASTLIATHNMKRAFTFA